MSFFDFKVLHKSKDSKARLGRLKTPHGEIETPAFVPVGTQATVKGLGAHELSDIGAELVFSNTYHLYLRGVHEVVQKTGGLGSFMGWSGPIITDSGGFQVFSLGAARRKVILRDVHGRKLSKFSSSVFLKPDDTMVVLPAVTKTREDALLNQLRPAKVEDDGVWFYSHVDGSKLWFDAALSIRTQEKLGADLIVAFDDHESPLWDYERTKLSLERTSRWGVDSLGAQKRDDQLMYGVVHGGAFEDLRKFSAKFTDRYFGAIAIGGSYTSKEVLYQVLDWCVPYFQNDKPRHLLGVGEVVDLFEGVSRGMDFFDCVAPTRRARHGNIYICPKSGGERARNFTLQITNTQYRDDMGPLDKDCLCMTCQRYTRSYIHHLFRVDEMLGLRLASYHNVFFIVNLMKTMREAIGERRFEILKKEWVGD